jgi:hypothetical protein
MTYVISLNDKRYYIAINQYNSFISHDGSLYIKGTRPHVPYIYGKSLYESIAAILKFSPQARYNGTYWYDCQKVL